MNINSAEVEIGFFISVVMVV